MGVEWNSAVCAEKIQCGDYFCEPGVVTDDADMIATVYLAMDANNYTSLPVYSMIIMNSQPETGGNRMPWKFL